MSAPAEACQLAQNLAKNCGYSVFPCGDDKAPTRPKREGGKGFQDATTDPHQIAALWRRWPGPLIGVATGEQSSISVLDIDTKSDSARAWWVQNENRLPATRTYRTRSGGLHLVFLHVPGIRNRAGNRVPGIDVRGDGGYIIFWFAAGFECVDHTPPAPWPHWLTMFFWPPPKPKPAVSTRSAPLSDDELEKIKQRAIDLVRRAAESQRHDARRAAGRLLGGIQHRAGFSDAEAVRWLLEAQPPASYAKKEEQAIIWGLEKGREEPIKMSARR